MKAILSCEYIARTRAAIKSGRSFPVAVDNCARSVLSLLFNSARWYWSIYLVVSTPA
jgi:hypothetical protein